MAKRVCTTAAHITWSGTPGFGGLPVRSSARAEAAILLVSSHASVSTSAIATMPEM